MARLLGDFGTSGWKLILPKSVTTSIAKVMEVAVNIGKSIDLFYSKSSLVNLKVMHIFSDTVHVELCDERLGEP